MTKAIKRICITGDLARMIQPLEMGYWINQQRIFHILQRAIRSGTGLPVDALPSSQYDTIYSQVHAAMDERKAPLFQRWVETYHAEPTSKLLELFSKLYAGSIVVGYELSPLMKKAFWALSIPFIDIIAHPVRYMPQLVLGFSSGHPELEKTLCAHAMPSESFFLEASLQKARYLPNIVYNYIPDNTLFIFGQKPVDKVLIKNDGSIYSMMDHAEQFDEMISKHALTCFQPHPRGSAPELMEFFRRQKRVLTLPHKDFPDLNTYMYLAHDSITTVIGLNSSVLVEAHFFNKAMHNLAPFEHNFFYDLSSSYACGQTITYPLPAESYMGASFWHEIASCLLSLAPFTVKKTISASLPNLRLIFRGGGGFDDAQSHTQCVKIGNVEQRLASLESKEPSSVVLPEQPVVLGSVKIKRISGACVHVGCGNTQLPGYLGCDARSTPVVDIVCNPWEMHRYFTEARIIYSRHMLEHLSFSTMQNTLRSWFTALAKNGQVHILTADINQHSELLKKTVWSAAEGRNPHSDMRKALAGLCGQQQNFIDETVQVEGAASHEGSYKSWYTAESLSFFLRAAGFSDIETSCAESLEITAYKRMASGERQVGPQLADIRADHRGRYRHAMQYLRSGMRVLDVACGVGYGSWMCAQTVPGLDITAVDIDTHAIKYAKEFYASDNISFCCDNVLHFMADYKFDVILCFEAIEHMERPKELLTSLFSALKPGGKLICSTPNENHTPFSVTQFPFHLRHYTLNEFFTTLHESGYTVESMLSQHYKESEKLSYDLSGLYLVAVSRKAEM